MKSLLLIMVCYASFRSSDSIDLRVDPLVITSKGLIRGLRANDGDYSMFLGIPFGNVDPQNPFGLSTPYPPFESTFNAYHDTTKCPQIFNNTAVGSLDCLQLNVYVPNIASTQETLPVLVWIHGGAFAYGFAGRYYYGPRHIVKHNVILVTINYRMGPYGFMCLNTPTIPGNQGLKDQLLALKWVKDNINTFGGDPNQITLSGESAGAASVDLHLLSPHDKLYNKVIMQSGTSLTPLVFNDWNLDAPIQLAVHLGFETDNTDDALAFLASTDPSLVIAATNALGLEFYPCVEKKFPDAEMFIENHPVNLRAPNKVVNTPILIGFNSNEMLFLYGNKNEDYFANLNDVFRDRIKLYFDFGDDEDTLNNASRIVRNFFIGDEDINIDAKQDLIDFDSDLSFIRPTVASIENYMAQNSGDIFLYMFSYSGKLNFVKNVLNFTGEGAAHADELGYLFQQEYSRFFDVTPDDQLIIDRVTTLWTNFVKYSNPTPEVTDLLPIKWLPVTEQSLNYLNIDAEMKLQKRPFKQRIAFWELFYSKYERFQRGWEE